MKQIHSLLVLIANLIVLGLTLKLYTEYAKNEMQRGRTK